MRQIFGIKLIRRWSPWDRYAGEIGPFSSRRLHYEHIKTARLQSGNPTKIQTHNPHRVPAAKIEPIVWQEVKRFIMNECFQLEYDQLKATIYNSSGVLLKVYVAETGSEARLLLNRFTSIGVKLDNVEAVAKMIIDRESLVVKKVDVNFDSLD